jgi:hypothetical protein
MRKRTIAISLSVLAASALAGGAYAASQSSSSPPQAFLNDVARRLHVSPARLGSAIKQAFIDRIDAAVAAGHLSPAQARAIKQRIEQGGGLPLLPLVGPGLPLPAPPLHLLPGLGGGPGPHLRFAAPLEPPVILMSAASYLHLSVKALAQELRSGKTLAQIASAEGRSKAGLESAITAAFSSQLEKSVKAGQLPQAVEQRILSAFRQHVADLVEGRFPLAPGIGPGLPPLPGGPKPLGSSPPGGVGLGAPPAAKPRLPMAPVAVPGWL